MILTEIIESFKTKLDPSKLMDSLEKETSFYDKSENDSGKRYEKIIHTVILEMILSTNSNALRISQKQRRSSY